MIPSIVEKLGHVAGVAVLCGPGRLLVASAAGPDPLLAVLFIVVFAMTRKFVLTGSSSQPAGRCVASIGSRHHHRNVLFRHAVGRITRRAHISFVNAFAKSDRLCGRRSRITRS